MAGKRQHHIPRSLQRGFLFSKEAEKTYVYRKNGHHSAASINDVAVEGYFYSHPSTDGNNSLDDNITKYETELAHMLETLRKSPTGNLIPSDLAAEVIAHLVPRNAHMRHIVRRGFGQMLSRMQDTFSDETSVKDMMGLGVPSPNETWKRHFDRFLDESPQIAIALRSMPIPKELLHRAVYVAAREHAETAIGKMTSMFGDVLLPMSEEMGKFIRDGHNKSLGDGRYSESQKTALQKLEWQLLEPIEGIAVMPDCVALGIDDDNEMFMPLLMTTINKARHVVMPIASTQILVGSRVGTSPPILTMFNADAIACSSELFISATQRSEFPLLACKMGERWQTEMDTTIEGLLEEKLPTKKSSKGSRAEVVVSAPINYQVSLIGLKNDGENERLSENVRQIVSNLSPLFQLSKLDGISFSSEFQKTLDEVDRGADFAQSREQFPDHIAAGAATVFVVRGGELKVQLLLNSAYGLSLLGKDQQDAEVVVHLVAAGLAQACTLSQIEYALPGFLMEPVAYENHDGLLHCAVRKAIRAYRYAHDSVGLGADNFIKQEFLKYMQAAFRLSCEALAEVKKKHANEANFQNLFETSIEAAGEMLTSAARVIGHNHGKGEQEIVFDDEGIDDILTKQQLSNWIGLFAKDLRRFWNTESWTREDFYDLNIHVERLLWANGVAIWRDPDGHGTMITSS